MARDGQGVFYDAGFLVYNTGCRDGDAGKDLLLLLTDDAAEAVDDAGPPSAGVGMRSLCWKLPFSSMRPTLMAVPPTSKQL